MPDPAPLTRARNDSLILIVDDYPDGRRMYASFLELSGFRVAEAADGLTAVERTRELLPSLVLMDLSLPGIDGWEAARRLKGDDRTRHIPIIVLTAHSVVPSDQTSGLCDGLITKPCLPDALIVEICRLLGGESATTAV